MMSILALLIGIPIVVYGTIVWSGRRVVRGIAAAVYWLTLQPDDVRLPVPASATTQIPECTWNLN